MSTADDTFLSRWSRRKAQVRGGAVPMVAPTDVAAQPAPAPLATPASPTTPAGPIAAAPSAIDAPAAASPQVEPPPTLEDVARLTPDSHYGRFVQPGVDPAVKNAALKKLFTDPQFNVMDGLDTYIDDYGKPDPLPASMLRQMAQARVLGLFTDDEADGPPDAATPSTGTSALAASNPEAPVCEPLPNEDLDLRLQPDDAAGRPGAEPGPEPHPGRER